MNNLLKLFMIAAIFILGVTSAVAHSSLQRISPQAGEVFTVPPAHFSIEYSKEVRLVKLNLVDQFDNNVALPKKLLRQESKQHLIEFPTLSVGSYRLSWILMGSDGHKMKGKTHFSIIEK